MKKTKRFIGFLLVLQMMLMCTLIPGAMAADVVTETPIESAETETVLDMSADIEMPEEEFVQDELMPMPACECDIYQNNRIDLQNNVPNATYYWTSNGTSSGTIFSIAYMDDYGRTSYRVDLIPYNGLPLHHGNVSGPHSHTYTWQRYVNEFGEAFHTMINEVIEALP